MPLACFRLLAVIFICPVHLAHYNKIIIMQTVGNVNGIEDLRKTEFAWPAAFRGSFSMSGSVGFADGAGFAYLSPSERSTEHTTPRSAISAISA